MIDFAKLKKFCFSLFIAALVAAAAVAVLAVLFGEFNELTWRVFTTLFIVVVHALVSLSFIWDDDRNKTYSRLALFINTVFLIIVASFIVSVFAVWKIIDNATLWHLYQTFFLVGFASLHIDVLSKAMGKESYMDNIIYVNFLFIAIVVLMLQPVIYMTYAMETLGAFYYRLLAACGIVDGTLSILTIIFYKLYLHKHPEAPDVFRLAPDTMTKQRSIGGFWLVILLAYLLFQVVMPALWALGMYTMR